MMDPQVRNTIVNKLKEQVGESGAFILYIDTGGTDDNAVTFYTHGALTRVQGLSIIGAQYTVEKIRKKIFEAFRDLPREPD
jgi:hypothetical protein